MFRRTHLVSAILGLATLLSIAGASNAQESAARRVVSITVVDPVVVKGLEAVAAANGKKSGPAETYPEGGQGSFAVALFTDADQPAAADESCCHRVESICCKYGIGAIYVSSGNEQLPTGYYLVELTRQPSEPVKDGRTSQPLYGITFVPSPVGASGSGGAAWKRQHSDITISKYSDRIRFVNKGGKDVLDTTTLGPDIGAAAKQQFNKSKSNVKNN